MAYNKFITKSGTTLLDLTEDNITPQDVRQGVQFHGRDGVTYTGTFGINKTEINAEGELIVTYSDGASLNLGNVIGPAGNDGVNGEKGADGTGIAKVELDGYNLIVTLTTGTTINLGNVRGEKGLDGIDGKDGANGSDGKDGSNGKDGVDGKTPYIKEGYWWIGETNTNVKAEGTDGTNGKDGVNGTSAFEQAKTGGYFGTETEFITALANIIDKRNITLGLHTDGLIYLFINNSPVGNGIALPTASVNEIVGNIDSDNNIVITGALADGSYSVKYEMNNGSTVDIGELVLNSTIYYSVTNELTNCTTSNGISKAIAGQSYYAAITAKSGYELKSVSATMGGNPISIENGVISLTNVTGDIIITAVAEAIEVINLLPLSIDTDGSDYVGIHEKGGDGWEYGYRISGSTGAPVETANTYCSGFMPLSNIYDKVFIKNITLGSEQSQNNICFYNAAKERIYGISGVAGAFTSQVTAGEDGVYSFRASNWTADDSVAYFRFSCGGITADTVVIVEHHTDMS